MMNRRVNEKTAEFENYEKDCNESVIERNRREIKSKVSEGHLAVVAERNTAGAGNNVDAGS